MPCLLYELAIGRTGGPCMKLLRQLVKIAVLVIDGWGLVVLDDAHRRDLLKVFDPPMQPLDHGHQPASH
ncbi:ATP-binding protein [Janthinobacterium sp. EB271-G4-3-2]|uniref:ATP-binding protein n=1 Tax=Janthinobacterium sp. EB271-G4-3-2 TaxID=2775058 RepID=UPI0022A831BC|nr:ATP-binding protein [Janthinobacterium sp. EB271-G4-3-2]